MTTAPESFQYEIELPDAELRIGPPCVDDLRQLARLAARTMKWWLAPVALAAVGISLAFAPSATAKARLPGTVVGASVAMASDAPLLPPQ